MKNYSKDPDRQYHIQVAKAPLARAEQCKQDARARVRKVSNDSGGTV